MDLRNKELIKYIEMPSYAHIWILLAMCIILSTSLPAVDNPQSKPTVSSDAILKPELQADTLLGSEASGRPARSIGIGVVGVGVGLPGWIIKEV